MTALYQKQRPGEVDSDRVPNTADQLRRDDDPTKDDFGIEETADLREQMEAMTLELRDLREEQTSSQMEEERLSMEVAFLEEEKEYYQKQLDDTRTLLFTVQSEFDKSITEIAKYKGKWVQAELDRMEEAERYLEETAKLFDDKCHVTRVIQSGLPLELESLKHSLTRTSEYLALKAENRRIRKELACVAADSVAQDAYIAELESAAVEMSRMLCRFHPVPKSATPNDRRRQTERRIWASLPSSVRRLVTGRRCRHTRQVALDDFHSIWSERKALTSSSDESIL